jgi:hypothetical protein
MAALSANRATASKNLGAIRRWKMKASTTVYAGSMVMLDSNGLANPAAASASNQGCQGCATEKVASAASGTYWVKAQEGTFLFDATSIADTSASLVMYASDDQTFDETQGANEPVAGYLHEVVSSTSGWLVMGMAFDA